MTGEILAFLAGLGLASAVLFGLMTHLRRSLAAAHAAAAEVRAQHAGLRHDLRGILSPALLVSDRLLTHEEPHVRRAAEVMIKTVERATARLGERPDQAPAQTMETSSQR